MVIPLLFTLLRFIGIDMVFIHWFIYFIEFNVKDQILFFVIKCLLRVQCFYGDIRQRDKSWTVNYRRQQLKFFVGDWNLISDGEKAQENKCYLVDRIDNKMCSNQTKKKNQIWPDIFLVSHKCVGILPKSVKHMKIETQQFLYGHKIHKIQAILYAVYSGTCRFKCFVHEFSKCLNPETYG